MAGVSRQRVPRDPSEYLTGLRDQRELLRNAAERYDQGSEAEAKNLALRIRVLVHDGSGSGSSLLGQLGVKERLPYLDTALAEHPPEAIVRHAGLCMIRATLGPGGSSRYIAPLDRLSVDRQHPPAAFIDWWRDPVLIDGRGNSFSRRGFVLAVANTDGGAHVDQTLSPAYAALTRQGSLGFRPGAAEDPLFTHVALPSVRQIAYELERTLEEELAEDPTAPFGLRVRNPICSLSIHETVEAGRNDPCPCGSGQKMKQCFGQRRPHRRLTLQDLVDQVQ